MYGRGVYNNMPLSRRQTKSKSPKAKFSPDCIETFDAALGPQLGFAYDMAEYKGHTMDCKDLK